MKKLLLTALLCALTLCLYQPGEASAASRTGDNVLAGMPYSGIQNPIDPTTTNYTPWGLQTWFDNSDATGGQGSGGKIWWYFQLAAPTDIEVIRAKADNDLQYIFYGANGKEISRSSVIQAGDTSYIDVDIKQVSYICIIATGAVYDAWVSGSGGTDLIPPSKPTGLMSASTTNQTSFSWSPNDPSERVIGYNFYQDGNKVNDTPIYANSYIVKGLQLGIEYVFEVTALDAAGNESERSDKLILIATDTTPPAPPDGFEGEPNDGMVLLSWTANTEPDLKGYKIYKNDSFLLNTGKITSTIITGLTNGVTYRFGLAAYDYSNNVSPVVSITVTPQDKTAPATPVNLSGTAGNKVLNIFWSAVADPDLKGYKIYVNDVALPGLTTSIYKSLTGLTNGTSYSIYVAAVDQSGNESDKSNILVLTPSLTADVTPPGVPDWVTATVNKTTIKVSWHDVDAIDLLGYFVYLDGVKVNYAPLTNNAYDIANLTRGKTYKVQVTAVDNSGNESALSEAVTVKIPILSAPANFKAKQIDGQIVLSWDPPPADPDDPQPDHYTIFRNGQQLANVTVLTWTDDDAEPEQGYTYEIQAVTADGLKSDRAVANIYFSFKEPPTDFSLVNLPFSVGGMLHVALEFLKKYAGWISLVLGVIFGPILIGFVLGLKDRRRDKEKIVSVDGKVYTRKELKDADRAFREKHGTKYDPKPKAAKTKASKIAKAEKGNVVYRWDGVTRDEYGNRVRTAEYVKPEKVVYRWDGVTRDEYGNRVRTAEYVKPAKQSSTVDLRPKSKKR